MNPVQGRKVALGFILAIPVLLVADIVQFLSVQGVVNSHRRLAESTRVLAEVGQAGAALREAEVSVGEFLASGDPAAIPSYQAQAAEARDSVQQLLKLTEGNAEFQAPARSLEPLVARRLDLLQVMVDLRSKAPLAPEKQKGLEAEGKKQMEAVQAVLTKIRKGELEKLASRVNEARATTRRTTYLTPLSAALGLWLVLLAALLLYRDARARKWSGIERRLYSRVVEMLPVGLCLVDDVGLIFYTNPAADALFGYEPGGLVGRHVTALHSSREEGTHFFEEVLDRVRVRGSWAGEFASRKKNGAAFTCFAHASNMDVPGKVYRVFLYEDASARPQS
jgi:PAS domain S-box-containing protein